MTTARELTKRTEQLGGQFLRQTGSHRFYRFTIDGQPVIVNIPQHRGDLPAGTANQIKKTLDRIERSK